MDIIHSDKDDYPPAYQVHNISEILKALENNSPFLIAEDFKFTFDYYEGIPAHLLCFSIDDCFSIDENTAAEDLAYNALDLRRLKIGNEGAKDIAYALAKTNAPLNELHLWGNNIGDEGAKAIAHALEKTGAPLNKLDLSDNNIGDEGAKAIAYALERTPAPLNYLDLSGNKIRDEGAKAFAHALAAKTSAPLYELNLTDNYIRDEGEGEKAIVDALVKTIAPLKLYINHKCIEKEPCIKSAINW